jgi:hypothetical protein
MLESLPDIRCDTIYGEFKRRIEQSNSRLETRIELPLTLLVKGGNDVDGKVLFRCNDGRPTKVINEPDILNINLEGTPIMIPRPGGHRGMQLEE